VELAFERPIDQVAFTLPGGRIINVPSFPSRGRFLVRFAARVPGAYHWSGGGRQGDFEAVAAAGHGQVARDPHAAHRLMLTDGTPFWPLGENRFNVYDPTWNYQHQSIEQYLASMQAAGENTLRLFVICDCEDESRADRVQLGCLEPSPGRFDEAAAERYDRIVDAAERDGIYVIFGVWAIGFTEGNDTWKSWADNPYRALGSRNQFFTDESIRRVAAGKLRYVAARWGWSTHLLAVDLLNEPEWDGRIPENVWIPWAEKMEKAWRADDPFGHLVTAGPVGLQYNLGGDERPWYGYAGDDLVQWHLYGKEFYEPHALADEMTRKVREVWGFDKPILVGEFGYGGEDKTTYDHTHVGIWSATFAGAGVLMHSAPAFNIDSDEPMTPARAAHVLGLSRFLASLP
ncbi:MAG: cellulase family glycosylhydrolase, partial [Polyangia bacterium]